MSGGRSGVPLPEIFMHHHSGEFSHMTHQGNAPFFPFGGPLGLGFLRHDPGRVYVEGPSPISRSPLVPDDHPKKFSEQSHPRLGGHRVVGRFGLEGKNALTYHEAAHFVSPFGW